MGIVPQETMAETLTVKKIKQVGLINSYRFGNLIDVSVAIGSNDVEYILFTGKDYSRSRYIQDKQADVVISNHGDELNRLKRMVTRAIAWLERATKTNTISNGEFFGTIYTSMTSSRTMSIITAANENRAMACIRIAEMMDHEDRIDIRLTLNEMQQFLDLLYKTDLAFKEIR